MSEKYQYGDYMNKYGDQSQPLNAGGHPKAPAPVVPEQSETIFEYGYGPEYTMNRGPQRFMEGVASDTDVPNDFQRGAYGDTAPAAGRLAVPDAESVFKRAEDTMAERAHVGSASWIEAPAMLGDFVQGTQGGEGERRWEYAMNSGYHMNRPSAVRIDG